MSLSAIITVICFVVYYQYERVQIDKAIKSHDVYLQQSVSNQRYPQKPNNYSDLENILQHFNPTNPACRLDLYDALNEDRTKGIPFKETKVYKDWDNYYKINLTPIY